MVELLMPAILWEEALEDWYGPVVVDLQGGDSVRGILTGKDDETYKDREGDWLVAPSNDGWVDMPLDSKYEVRSVDIKDIYLDFARGEIASRMTKILTPWVGKAQWSKVLAKLSFSRYKYITSDSFKTNHGRLPVDAHLHHAVALHFGRLKKIAKEYDVTPHPMKGLEWEIQTCDHGYDGWMLTSGNEELFFGAPCDICQVTGYKALSNITEPYAAARIVYNLTTAEDDDLYLEEPEHWSGCYNHPEHHSCALDLLLELKTELDELKLQKETK